MKLKEWAKKEGISYQTAYRWFKAGSLPVKAYQSDSGTIIVQDEDGLSPESTMNRITSGNSDAMSHFLKKTVEFSKANYSIEDFAAYIIANFQLKINPSAPDVSLKYSKNKPSQNEINKHFKQFIKIPAIDKKEIINNLPNNTETLKEAVANSPELKDLVNINYSSDIGNSIKDFVEEATSVSSKPTPTSTLLVSSANNLPNNAANAAGNWATTTYYSSSGVLTPDFNYLAAQNIPLSINTASALPSSLGETWTGSFQPTPKEIESFRAFTQTPEISEKNDDVLSEPVKKGRGRPKRK